MTLIKRLWIAIGLCMLLAFGGSLVLNIVSARNYLQQQLQVKNIDNATALALSLSQLPKDPVTMELQLAAQFDAGHYRYIRVTAPSGQVLVERTFEDKTQEAPTWFTQLIPINAPPGQALIQDGWKQYGVLSLASHEQYAYQSLWTGTLELLAWFMAGSLLVGVAVTLVMRAIVHPLNQVVMQAHAITERRFIQIPEPSLPELRSVVRAMNSLVDRLRLMFGQEAARLEALRQRINTDPVTGLSTREHFLSQLKSLSAGEGSHAPGTLVVLRLNDLERLNREVGHPHVDVLLQQLAHALVHDRQHMAGIQVGRLRGSDFAIAYPAGLPTHDVATRLHQRLRDHWLPQWPKRTQAPDIFHMAAIACERGQLTRELLSRADEALAHAKAQGPNSLYVQDGAQGPALSGEEWRLRLTRAMTAHELTLVLDPVRPLGTQASGSPLLRHHQAQVRWWDQASEPPVAIDCAPMASHLQLGALMDLEGVRLALALMRSKPGALALTLSSQSLIDFAFRKNLLALLRAQSELCPRLLFEVHDYGAIGHFEALCELATTLKALGCAIGIREFSRSLAQGDKLAQLHPDYLKIAPSYLVNLATDPANQDYLQGLCAAANLLGMKVIATGVPSPDTWPLLAQLGFHAVAGPVLETAPGPAKAPVSAPGSAALPVA